MASSPDGKYVLTTGDQTARLWDVATGEQVQVSLCRLQRIQRGGFFLGWQIHCHGQRRSHCQTVGDCQRKVGARIYGTSRLRQWDLQYTPKRASNYGADVANYDDYPPTSDLYWTEFIHEVAISMGGLVDDYAIMNEVNTDGFWKGTQADFERLEIEAYDTLKQYDTIDANGDGVAATVYPSSSNEPGQTTQWQKWYAALQGHMDGFNTHDYMWGIKPGLCLEVTDVFFG
jgi:hypothetical protein